MTDHPPVEEMSIEDIVAETWETENEDRYDDAPDGGWAQWRAASDQWWHATVDCAHGKWTSPSNGPVDPVTAFRGALKQFREAHQ